jgi:hypothetical protein
MDKEMLVLVLGVVVMFGVLFLIAPNALKQQKVFEKECQVICQTLDSGFVDVDYRSYGHYDGNSEAVCQCYSCKEQKVIEKSMGIYDPLTFLW